MLQFAYLALQRNHLKDKCLFDWKQKDMALASHIQPQNFKLNIF